MTKPFDGTFDLKDLTWSRSYGSVSSDVNLLITELVMHQLAQGVDHVGAGALDPLYNSPQDDSFGYALSWPNDSTNADWAVPTDLVWLVGGWGPRKNLLVANAVRKLSACARLGEDTLSAASRSSNSFYDVITDEERAAEKALIAQNPEHSVFRLGDFPFGGPNSVNIRDTIVSGACSGYTQEEDHVIITHVLLELALKIWKEDNAVTR